jgi:hypothetical protein
MPFQKITAEEIVQYRALNKRTVYDSGIVRIASKICHIIDGISENANNVRRTEP